MNLPFLPAELPWIVDASLRIGAVLAVFLLVRPLLRRFIGSQWLALLWLVVLARLLAPWPVVSRWSIVPESKADDTARTSSAWKVSAHVVENVAPASASTTDASAPLPQALPTAPSSSSSPEVAAHPLPWQGLWLTGALAGLALFAVRVWRTQRFAVQSATATDARLLAVFESIPSSLRAGVSLRETDALDVPTLAGVWRKQIWMPRRWLGRLNDAELRHVLLHELGHAGRQDVLVQGLFDLAVCLHWFNPLVWLAARLAQSDREMACDAWVLAQTQGIEADEYGATLLKSASLLREPLSFAPAGVAMAASKRGLFARIAGVAQFRPHAAWRGVLGATALLGVVTAMTTSPLAAQAPDGGTTPQPSDAPGSEPRLDLPVGPARIDIAEKPQIQITARLVSMPEKAALQLLPMDQKYLRANTGTRNSFALDGVLSNEAGAAAFDAMGKRNDVTILSASRLVAGSGQRATIDVAPSAKSQGIGVSLAVTPTLNAENIIELDMLPRIVRGGAASAENNPATGNGEVAKKVGTSVNIFDGQTLILGGLRAKPEGDAAATDAPLLFMFITAEVVGQVPGPGTPGVATGGAGGGGPFGRTPGVPPVAPARQVEISARFVEIVESSTHILAATDPFLGSVFGGANPAPTGGGGPAGTAGFGGVGDAGSGVGPGPLGAPLVGSSLRTPQQMQETLALISKSGGVDLISAPRVTTKSGQRAVIEIIREFIYPTEFDSNGKEPPTLTPKKFETRNIGVTLEVEPIVSPDGATIDLQLVPQVVELSGFNRVGPGGASTMIKVPRSGPLPGDVRDYKLSAAPGETLQPIFSTRKITTSMSLGDGQTVVLGGLRQGGDIDEAGKPVEPRELIVFITAKVFDPYAPKASPVPGTEPAPAPGSAPGGSPRGTGELGFDWTPGSAPAPGIAPGVVPRGVQPIQTTSTDLLGRTTVNITMPDTATPATGEGEAGSQTRAGGRPGGGTGTGTTGRPAIGKTTMDRVLFGPQTALDATGAESFSLAPSVPGVIGQSTITLKPEALRPAPGAGIAPPALPGGAPGGLTPPVPAPGAGAGPAIDLSIAPEVGQFEGFINYGTQAPATGAGASGSIGAAGVNPGAGLTGRGAPGRLPPPAAANPSPMPMPGAGVSAGANGGRGPAGVTGATGAGASPAPAPGATAAVGAGGAAPAGAPPAAIPAYAKPVPGKAGFVTSPYAPGHGYVDVRGFPPGTQVKCPYTGQTFLVP